MREGKEMIARLTKVMHCDNGNKLYDYSNEVVREYKDYSDRLNLMFKKLAYYEDLEEQGLLMKLPCEIGTPVYVITTCKDFGKVLDGTLWGENGGFGTATGYYCPYELSDSCPHEDGFEECEGGCESFKNKLAVFEDFIECITVYEHETVIFLINCGSVSFEDFYKSVFLTKEEAEEALLSM